MQKPRKFDDLTAFFAQFPDEKACRKYLEFKLWKNVPTCPHCKHDEKIYRYRNEKLFKCSKCRRQFQVTTGTMYENSNLPLQKWFLAMYLIGISKKGVSSVELAVTLGITQKSAWYLAHKIRFALQFGAAKRKQLEGVVECDETYVGGRRKGVKRGRFIGHKTPVFGILQRNGRLFITPVPDAKRKTIEPIIHANVKRGTRVMTDEWWAYTKLKSAGYKHGVVKHKIREYVNGDIHVNSLEGAWSLLKRSFRGVYHRPSKKHMEKYCKEFEFKYNTRNDSQTMRFNKMLKSSKVRVKQSEII